MWTAGDNTSHTIQIIYTCRWRKGIYSTQLAMDGMYFDFIILWQYFYTLVSTNYIDFVVSTITGNNQWTICISLDFHFRGLSEPRNPRKLEPTINNDFTEIKVVFFKNIDALKVYYISIVS